MSTPAIVGIHLDLKYLMPRKSWLNEWVRTLPDYGINTLLLEYEDKFPFTKYAMLRDREAFTPKELTTFLGAARGAGLRIIPLVQTLSHLEFALAHEDLASLREAPDVPTQICPSNPDAVAFVLDLINDVLAFHEEDTFFHLGGDECWFLGHCKRCAARVEKYGKVETWGRHEKIMAQNILAMGKQPILWDDVFWKEPESVVRAGLPPDTVLCCWNYSTTDYTEDSMKQVITYHQNGFATLAAPCLNWGVMVPQRNHTLKNTWAWANRMHESSMAGMLNTAWACFHVPPAVTMLQIAATGTLCAGETVDDDWEAAFYQKEYGISVPRVPEAMEKLGKLWEVTIPGQERPVTPIPYGYMDMVIHFPGGQDERRRRGAYPLDWNEVDANTLYGKKLELMRGLENVAEHSAKAAELEQSYAAARATFEALAAGATRNQATAALLALLATLKEQYAKVVQYHLRGDGNGREELRAALETLSPRLQESLAHFYEPTSAKRLFRLWHEPVLNSLADAPVAAAAPAT